MSCFKEVRSLNNDKETLSLLTKAAQEVNTLLERRGWKVDLLTEFMPNDKKLLGLNIKHDDHITIKIRCRTQNRELYSYTCIFHTLLHELTHIKCGPHDDAFYALLESLTKETKGQILGATTYRVGSCSRDEIREKMADAAERRMFSIGPRVLGSTETSNMSKTMSAREAAALAAIKRASINVVLK